MCGIVGYCDKQDIHRDIIESLKKIDYRGYDSHGVALVSENPVVYREVGDIDVENYLEHIKHSKAETAIAHTRWATHGEVSKANTHPFVVGDIAIVHNGTIDTSALSDIFPEVKCRTEVDSEWIAQLIALHRNSYPLTSLENSVKSAIAFLGEDIGAFLVVDLLSNQLIGYSDGSPLLVSSNMVASDIQAFKDKAKTKRLNSKVMVVMSWDFSSHNNMRYINLGESSRPLYTTCQEHKEIKKSSSIHGHYMLDEILEQIDMVDRLQPKTSKQEQESFDCLDYLTKGYHDIVFFGCGSSYYVGMLLSKTLYRQGFGASYEYASEMTITASDISSYPSRVYCAISQSGETKDTVEVAKKLAGAGARVSVIENKETSTSTLSQYVTDQHIDIEAGPEYGVAATKSFMATYLSVMGVAKRSPLKDILSDVYNKPETFGRYTAISSFDNCLFLGTGLYYPIAMEAALKMKEVAYIHAEGMPAAEMKHGPLALVDDNMPVIFLYSKHQSCKRDRIEANIQEIISRKGRVLLITDESFNIPNIEEIEVPHVRLWTEQPMVHLMAVQLLSYYVGCERGCDIDKPRNLAKSVTV